MLIQSALDILSTDLRAINFIELGRFGGVVHTAEMPIQDADGITRKRVPVSCTVDEADCNLDQFYQDLVPDSTKHSVVYWEITQAFQDIGAFQGNIQNYKRTLQGQARLVGWLNQKLLGLKNCNVSGMAVRAVYETLNGRYRITSGELQNSTVQFRVSGEANKDARQIFGRYDYDFKQAFWKYPYDFFAIDVDVELIFAYGCEYEFPVDKAINCVDYTKL